jgi:hypothetical protein
LQSQKKAKISSTKLNLKTQNIYIKPCFKTTYLDKNAINLLKQKVAILGLFHFVNHEPPKVAQLAKNCPIWSP